MPIYDYQVYRVCWSNDILGQASTVQHTLLPCGHHISHHRTASKSAGTMSNLRANELLSIRQMSMGKVEEC